MTKAFNNTLGILNKRQAIVILGFMETSTFEVFHTAISMFKGSNIACKEFLNNWVELHPNEDSIKLKHEGTFLTHPYQWEGSKPQVRYWYAYDQPRHKEFETEKEALTFANACMRSVTCEKIETNF